MQYDIIIIGGGMVGAAQAAALRRSALRVALIDATPLNPSDDHRLIGLNYSSICLFNNLNLWPKLAPHAAAIHEVHVSHRGHFGMTRLCAKELNVPTLGYVVPAKHINTALYEALDTTTIYRPATLTQLTQDTDHATITINTPQGTQTLSGSIIIGADGAQSTVRDLLNIPVTQQDYEQSALVTITELNRSHRHIAYERFLKKGAIAMLPLVGNRAATIWTDSHQAISDLMQLDDSEFLKKLQTHFGYRLGRFNQIQTRYTYPLLRIQAAQQIKQRVILIGNAAHTLHPIAAQGLNLALYEIAALTEYLAKHSGRSISLQSLAAQQQFVSTQLSHYLSGLFATDFFLFNTARQLGLLSLDISHTLKERFGRHVIGQAGHVPFLLLQQGAQ